MAGGSYDPSVNRVVLSFVAVIAAQGAHSVEEYLGRLWESFPPARFLCGLVSDDLERGFVIINVSLFVFGVWCAVWPVWRRWNARGGIIAFWVAIELINGLGHPVWTIANRGYTPGVATALLLFVLALLLCREFLRERAENRVYRTDA